MSWAEIKKAVNSNLSKPLNELIEGITGKGNPTESNRTTIMNYLRLLEGASVIKSIQRGVVQQSDAYGNMRISITEVNPSKCFVILNNGMVSHESSHITGAYLISLAPTQLTVYHNRVSATSNNNNVSWQLIEFY